MTIYELQREWVERKRAAEQYLSNPDNMARLRKQLVSALCDPDYCIGPGKTFDWVRFAREFTEKDFQPPLSASDFLDYMLHPHFAPPGSKKRLSRSRVWWLIRLKLDVEDPVSWLEDPTKRRHGALVDMARKLNCLGITNVHISRFLVQVKQFHKPKIPERFRTEGTKVLAVQDDIFPLYSYSCVWGLVYRKIRKGRFGWSILFKEEVQEFPWRTEPVPYEQSPRPVVEEILNRHSFHPTVILFYTGRPYIVETKRLWWGYWPRPEELGGLSVDTTNGPVLVEGWDENGWPIGRKVPFKERGANSK